MIVKQPDGSYRDNGDSHFWLFLSLSLLHKASQMNRVLESLRDSYITCSRSPPMPDNGQRLTVTNAYGYSEYEPMVSYLSVVDDYGR